MSNQNIATPWNFFHAVEAYFGIKFEYDMAARLWSTKCTNHFTMEDNSLSIQWPTDGWCWLNPPFGQLTKFIDKCYTEYQKGCDIISIWPLSSDLNQIPVWKHCDIFPIHGRVWPEVRGCALYRWTHCPGRINCRGLKWDKKAGTLTEIYTR